MKSTTRKDRTCVAMYRDEQSFVYSYVIAVPRKYDSDEEVYAYVEGYLLGENYCPMKDGSPLLFVTGFISQAQAMKWNAEQKKKDIELRGGYMLCTEELVTWTTPQEFDQVCSIFDYEDEW